LGIGAPFGNATKYDEPWIGSAQSNEFDIKTININPSIAFRVNDHGLAGRRRELAEDRGGLLSPSGNIG
jgi:long-chain fatty acid transport protein